MPLSYGSQPSHACACSHRRFWATSPYLFSAIVLSLGTPILGLPIKFYDIEAYDSNLHGHFPLPMGTQA